MAVYVTGDKHQRFDSLWFFADRMKLTEQDYIIVLGDMGLFWRHDKKDANEIIKYFEKNYKFNLYFIDGNHENFKLLNALEEDENHMGYVSEHIRHLKRGRTYNIDGKKILALGGADSVDKLRRTPGLSWWEEETITDDDIARVDNGVHYDYILSHCCPLSIFNNNKPYLCTLGNIVDNSDPELHKSENKLEQVLNFIEFDKWIFAHYHVDLHLDDKFTCLFHTYEELI